MNIWRKSSHGSMINSALTDEACLGHVEKYGSIGSILRILLSGMELFSGQKLEMSGTVVLQLAVAECHILHMLLYITARISVYGPPGNGENYHSAQEQFIWPGMKRDVREWVNSCSERLKRKGTPQRHRHTLIA